MKYLLFVSTLLFAQNLKRDSSLEVVIDYENKLVLMDNKQTVRLQLSHKDAVPYCEKLSYADYIFCKWHSLL